MYLRVTFGSAHIQFDVQNKRIVREMFTRYDFMRALVLKRQGGSPEMGFLA